MFKQSSMPDDVRAALASWEYSDNPSPTASTFVHSFGQGAPGRLSSDSRKWSQPGSVVDTTFDEGVLRALCDLDCGVPLLLDRIKQSMVSCREAAVFFKKRAGLEEEYGRSMLKLSKTTSEVYSMNDGKAGTYVSAWQRSLKIHENIADNRLGFAQKLNEMSEELASLAKEVDKNRKQTKDLATRYERSLIDAEVAMEKSKTRLDLLAEDLERVIVAKEGESLKETGVQQGGTKGNQKRAIGKAVAKGGLLLKGRNPSNYARQEDDVRQRMSNASDAYRKNVIETQTLRQEYFNFQLPRILRALKECADEIDLGTQYHLNRYAFLFESVVLADGTALAPPQNEEVAGLRNIFESVDNRSDFKSFMQSYALAHASTGRSNSGANTPRILKRDGPQEDGYLPAMPTTLPGSVAPMPYTVDHSNLTFGVDLADQMGRDSVEIPLAMTKCCEAIEQWGIRNQGIYRISGTVSKVARLKDRLDKDLETVDLNDEEWTSDINVVASAMKMWLRDLPEPLLTFPLHQGFVDSAKIDNDRLRHIRLHERVNELPDANYATLKYFLGHLHRISQHETENQMSISNLAIVFGPTLLWAPPSPGSMMAGGHLPGMANQPANGQVNGTNGMAASNNIGDVAHWQNRAIETILEHYVDIFIDDTDGGS